MVEIKGFPRYTITEQGTIHDLKCCLELKPYIETNGYLRVCLTDETKKQFKKYHHRLVAETFIPNPDNLPVVDHINGNKQDNRIENLRWVTHVANSQNWERENVAWDKVKQRWRARRMINGKFTYIGTFITKEEAEEAVIKFKETGEVSTNKLRTNNTSGHKNIYFDKKAETYEVKKMINKKTVSKSGFKTVEDAIAYRDSL